MSLRFTPCLLLLLAGTVVNSAGCASSRRMLSQKPVEKAESIAATEETKPSPTAPVVDPLAPGYELEAAENWPAAIAFYGAVLRNQPANSTALHRMGVIATYREDYDAAANYYRRAMELEPRNAAILADTGYFLTLQKQYETAGLMLEAAVLLDPENEQAVNNLATVKGLRGDIDEALVLFRRVNSPAAALLSLASIHEQRNEWQLALVCYLEARSVDPAVTVPDEITAHVAELRQGLVETINDVASSESAREPVAASDSADAPTVADSVPPASRPLRAAETPAETVATTSTLDDAMFFPDDHAVMEETPPGLEELVSAEWELETAQSADDQIETASGVVEEPVASRETGRPRETALNGCCPVALRDASQLVDGRPEFCLNYEGVIYALSSADAVQRFRLNPERYLPSAGGLDVISVRGGKMERGSLHFSTWFRNRLFLFTSAEHVDEFRNDPLRYVELD